MTWGDAGACREALDPDDWRPAQRLGAALRAGGSDGVLWPSVRDAGGLCVGLFHPDGAGAPVQGRHLDYHWDGARVDCWRELGSGAVYAVTSVY